jgi:hypothetical protein
MPETHNLGQDCSRSAFSSPKADGDAGGSSIPETALGPLPAGDEGPDFVFIVPI